MSHGAFFQTNTEMAERLYAVAAEFAGLSGRERVFDLYCGIGTIGLTMAGAGRRGLGPGDRPRGDRRRRAQRQAQQDRERPLPRRQRPHRRAAAARAGRQARRRRDRPAARRPLAEDRPPGARVRGEADRLRLLQPDHAGPQRGPAQPRPAIRWPREAGRHVPPDPAHRVRRAVREEPPERAESGRGFGVAAGLDPEVARPLAAAAQSSATTRSGPTTIPAPRAWRRWPCSPPRRRGSSSASP